MMIYVHLFILSFLMLVFMYKYMLILLMLVELLVLNVSLVMFLVFGLMSLEFYLVYFLVFSVCEGVLGLGLLVLVVRFYGSDFYSMFNLSKF